MVPAPAALQVFYRSHIIGFLGFTVFAYMHYVGSWFMFMPPLTLYAIDLVFRAGQLAHTTPLHIRRLTQEDTIITVQMSTDKVSVELDHCSQVWAAPLSAHLGRRHRHCAYGSQRPPWQGCSKAATYLAGLS